MSEGTTDFSGCHALVVEDSLVNRQLVGAMLSAMGIGHIHMAVDGVEGLERAAELRPDIVILDIMMPRLDGFGFLQRFRAEAASAETPVIITTALGEQDERVRAFELGASDYVVKPIERREFAARVSVHLRTRLLVDGLSRYRERLDRDLAAARGMQLALLPPSDRIAALERSHGVRLSSIVRCPDELGGDLWDAVPIGYGGFAVTIADFTGHGVAAAINTFRLHVMMARKGDLIGDPAALLERVNKTLMGVLPRGHFATMAHAVFDPGRDEVVLALAGSPGLVLRDSAGSAQLISQSSHPLGLVADAPYRNITVPFGAGHGLLLATDGLIEAADGEGRLLGEEGARSLAAGPESDPIARIEDLARQGWRFEDDLTAVWVERLRPGS